LTPLRKNYIMQLPLRHQEAKVHKELISNELYLEELSALVSWWQKKTFRSRLKFQS
jgi:hypothetical protein